jgi:hypothetical protein
LECQDGFIAYKFELTSELDLYGVSPEKRRDFTAGGDTSGSLGHRGLLLYQVPDLESVPVIANRECLHILKPDAYLESISMQDFANPFLLAQALARVEMLAPRIGGWMGLYDSLCDDDGRQPGGIDAASVDASWRLMRANTEALNCEPVCIGFDEDALVRLADAVKPTREV